MRSASKPLHLLLTCAAVLALLVFAQAYNRNIRQTIEPYAQVEGKLKEWSLLGSANRPKALRFTLKEGVPDFRIDPKFASALVSQQAKDSLRAGARIAATVSARQLRSPAHPLLASESRVVWVYGLRVGGDVIFTPQDVERVQRKDDRWGLASILVCAIGCVYFTWKWINERHAA